MLSIRLFFLQVYPTEQVVSQYKNHQTEVISDYDYLVLDTNGKNLISFNKEYVVVIDKKPFSLNSYANNLESLLILNYIMKGEYKDFDYSDIMAGEGKNYYKVSQESYEKINKLNNVKGIYAYVRDNTDNYNAWSVGNYLGNIDKKNFYSKDSLQNKIKEIVIDNNIPSRSFYLDEKSIFAISSIENIENNKNIKLTIDLEIEEKIREVLNRKEFDNLNNVSTIIMESNTGKIRGMVQKYESEANINLGVKGVGYEPGSIFKLITLSAALEEGKVTMNNSFYCKGDICNGGHGWMSLENALYKSCNDTFAKVGSKVGYNTLMNYCKELGLFEKVINLEEETRGIRPQEEVGLSNISIGQCLTVSPVQIIGAVNTIINDGVYVKPYLVESIVDINDNEIERFSTDEKTVFSKTTSKIVKNSMIGVVNYGTGENAKVENMIIGGKTGSATSGTNNSTHGWFIGYFEYNNIEYTMIVFVPDIVADKEELGGGNTAAPIFREIVKNIIDNGQ